MMKFLSMSSGILLLFYPIAVYFSLKQLAPGILAAMLILLLSSRFYSSKAANTLPFNRTIIFPVVVVLCAVMLFANRLVMLKFYPVLVSCGLLAWFSWTLKYPPSAIERIARLTDSALPDFAIVYTRYVTVVWCCFFLANALIALWTAVYASMEIWTLYNGVISYVLIGLVFVIEYPVRLWYRHVHRDA